VPSHRDPELVPSFAARVADGLRLPFRAVVTKTRTNVPQAEMANTAQQSRNVAGAFEIDGPVPPGPVLLVDDTVDSRWTITEVGACLRAAGSGPVFPLALAQAASD
jgi:ATP-dependent DNA helicase RecQ